MLVNKHRVLSILEVSADISTVEGDCSFEQSKETSWDYRRGSGQKGDPSDDGGDQGLLKKSSHTTWGICCGCPHGTLPRHTRIQSSFSTVTHSARVHWQSHCTARESTCHVGGRAVLPPPHREITFLILSHSKQTHNGDICWTVAWIKGSQCTGW